MPILEVVIRQLHLAGVEAVTLAVGHLASLLMAYFGDGSAFGIPITYSVEAVPLGTAGPLGLLEGLEETFLVLNGDLLTDLDFAAMIAAHQDAKADATVGVFRREVRIDLGVVEEDGFGHIARYIEKPTHQFLVSMGIYVFEPSVLRHLPVGERCDLPALIEALLSSSCAVLSYRHEGYWLDIGRPDDYQVAQGEFDRLRDRLLGPTRRSAGAAPETA